LAEATPSSRGLQWFTRKPLGYSVEPQNRGRRLDEEVRPPRPVQPPLSLVLRCFEAEDTHRDRKACVEAKQVAVAGHPFDEENPKLLSKGSLVFWVPPYILFEGMDGSQLLEP
jgi:hypothetical protein